VADTRALIEALERVRPKRARVSQSRGCVDVVFYAHRGVDAFERRTLCEPFLLDIARRYGFEVAGAGSTLVPPLTADVHICPRTDGAS
jgi:hypothetical protein